MTFITHCAFKEEEEMVLWKRNGVAEEVPERVILFLTVVQGRKILY